MILSGRSLLKRLFTSRVPPLTNIGPRIDLIDDLEVGENLPRRKLFDFLLVQAVEPMKERPLVRRQFRMLFGARHGDSEHGARSTFIFAASLARSRPRSRRLSSRRALRAARQVLEFLSASFSRTIAPLDALISIPKHKSTNGRPKNAGRCPNKSNSDRPSSKNCSLNRSGEYPSVGTIFAHLIALASGQPWRSAYNLPRRRPRSPPTSTSASGCGCAALCLQ